MSKYGEYLYKSLPSIYRIRDIDMEYTLKRYLDALGTGLDIVDEETGKIITLTDVENMEARFLPLFSSMFGLSYDHNVPEAYQRRLLANIIEIYKRKGTKSVIEFIARELTGMSATVKEGQRTVFKTWNPSVDLTGTISTATNPKTYGGSYAHHYLGGENTDRFTIVVSLTNSNKDREEAFFDTQLLAKLTADLVPSYISVLFKAFGLSYKDSFSPKVKYSHLDRFYTQDTHSQSVIDHNEMIVTRMNEGKQNVSPRPTDVFKDILKLESIQDIKVSNINMEELILHVKDTLRDFVSFTCKYSDKYKINEAFYNEVIKWIIEDNKDKIKCGDDYLKELEVIDNFLLDLISSQDSSVINNLDIMDLIKDHITTTDTLEGVIEIVDSVHTKYPTSDIIELKDILEESSDVITEVGESNIPEDL